MWDAACGKEAPSDKLESIYVPTRSQIKIQISILFICSPAWLSAYFMDDAFPVQEDRAVNNTGKDLSPVVFAEHGRVI